MENRFIDSPIDFLRSVFNLQTLNCHQHTFQLTLDLILFKAMEDYSGRRISVSPQQQTLRWNLIKVFQDLPEN